MARLLTLLLLYQSGYCVGRYVSLARLVNESKVGYYDSLEAAGAGWHQDRHNIWSSLEHLLGILLAAYREFEDRVSLLGDSRGAKTAAIERFISERISDEFTIADVRESSLGASDSLIGKVLARLRKEVLIEPLGTGRSAKWRRLHSAPSRRSSAWTFSYGTRVPELPSVDRILEHHDPMRQQCRVLRCGDAACVHCHGVFTKLAQLERLRAESVPTPTPRANRR